MSIALSQKNDLRTQIEKSFRHCAQRSGVVESCFSLGGHEIRIQSTNRKLHSALTDALRHRQIDPFSTSHPSSGSLLTIRTFVSADAPVKMSTEQWHQASRPWKQNSTDSAPFVHYAGVDCRLSVLFPQTGLAFVCYPDVEQLPPWDRATPFREIFSAWFQRVGGQVVHGAAVATKQHAVLLAGAGGAGKSSTALTCLSHPELFYLGDDLCLVRQTDSGPVVDPLYSSAKLLTHDLDRFAHVLPPMADGSEKPTFFLHPHHRKKIGTTKPLTAVLVPHVTDQAQPRICELSRGDAWRALVPSTLSLLPDSGSVALKWMTRLIGELPVYRLELGSQREAIARTIHQFLT